jgi:predicted homoserine dehydrogenase-like protein
MFKQALDRRAEAGTPIQVGFVGAGRMGTGAICQIGLMRGIRTAIIADIGVTRAVRAFELCGYRRDDVVVTDKLSVAADALRAGKPVATADAEIVSDLDIDAVVEATGNPEVGARVAVRSILTRKHIIMLNVETDVIVGPMLYGMAKAANVVYTVSSGDEPGLIAEFYDRYAGLGFEVVAVGKAPSSIGLFDRYATPDSVAEDARRLGVNPHFLVTFRDATKTMIEMACISNYTGLVPDIRGMHGPVAGVNEIPQLFRPKSEGGILNRKGVVDFARPLKHPDGSIDFDRSVTPGVFLCVYTGHEQIREDLAYLDVTGSDGYYNMYTPYHLVTNEIPLSIVNAVEFSHPTIVPKLGLVTEVFGAAKRPLKAGEKIDGAGGSTVYALNDLYTTAKAENVVPLGLLTGAKLRTDVPTDAAITYDMVDIISDTTLYHLRAMQDAGAVGTFGAASPSVRSAPGQVPLRASSGG